MIDVSAVVLMVNVVVFLMGDKEDKYCKLNVR